ncbi:hypothetical protein [Sphingomonas sp.]|uniref:hypothetical protein n=1 Tax=Sphingomonas sp. TaxID=28214 RepID=UPI0026000E65|nr:hypothetical protein [Sphingomonas sp.]
MEDGHCNSADQCVLLFSTDWFRPYYCLLGLRVLAGEEGRFVEAMRAAARELIGQENDYFETDFGDARILKTKKHWLDALATFTSSAVPPALLDSEGHSLAERRRARDEIVGDHHSGWDELMAAHPASLRQSDWDEWIASITAAVPDYLRAFAWSRGFDPSDRH